MKQKLLFALILLISAGLTVVGFILLPDMVAVQIGLDGQVSSTMPKALAVLIPPVISALGAYLLLTAKETDRAKGWVLVIAGWFVLIVELLMNR